MINKANYQKLRPVPHTQVVIDDKFWKPKLNIIRNVTLTDVFTKFKNHRSGVLNNFDMVLNGKSGEYAIFHFLMAFFMKQYVLHPTF